MDEADIKKIADIIATALTELGEKHGWQTLAKEIHWLNYDIV